MTPRRCSIKGCPSIYRRQQHDVKFNKLPLKKNIRQCWLTNCGISSRRSVARNFSVCSRHFHLTDFQSLKNDKFKLKEGAVPTIFPWGTLPYVEPTPHTDIETEQTLIKRSNNKPGEINQQLVDKMVEIKSELGCPDDTRTSELNDSSIPFVTASQFSHGTRIEAQDLNGVWYSATVMEVDSEAKEVLVSFEKSIKSEEPAMVEWMEQIPMNSGRFRPFQTSVATYLPGEKCLARWTDAIKCPAIVQKVLENNTYEVRFDDGFVKVVKGGSLSKVKAVQSAKTRKKNKYASVLKANPLVPIPKVDLSKLHLTPVPRDGEWCCNWVNDVPVGIESHLECPGGYKRPSVIVEDWRLPAGWTKHLCPRPDELAKWDVALIGPTGKRFSSRTDVKVYFDEKDEVYNPDTYDFSSHKRRAKNLGLYLFTEEYKEQLKNRKLLGAKAQQIQLLDNLFCCQEPGCDKKFRKENLLRIHIKHYHKELANQLEICSVISEHKFDQPINERVLKNEIPDAGPIPVAIYHSQNFENTERVDAFFISYVGDVNDVDSKYD